MLVTWDDIDDSNDGIEVEEANLCLMEKDDAEEVTFSNSCLSCKKVEIIFDSLLKLQKLYLKNVYLKEIDLLKYKNKMRSYKNKMKNILKPFKI